MTCDSRRLAFGEATAQQLAIDLTDAELLERLDDYEMRELPRMYAVVERALAIRTGQYDPTSISARKANRAESRRLQYNDPQRPFISAFDIEHDR